MSIEGTLLCRPDGAIVHVVLPPMPPTLDFAGRTFRLKHEFHVTLLGRGILSRAGLLGRPDLGTAIRSAARGMRFSVELDDALWIVEQGDAATIIRMCSVTGSADFYERFETNTGVRIEPPPCHVTLYGSGTAKGIGIATAADLARCGRRLARDDAERLLRDIT